MVAATSKLPMGLPNCQIVKTYNRVGNSATKMSVTDAKNLPNTSRNTDRGLVSKTSIVPCFRSSEKLLIVIAGTKNKNTHGANKKNTNYQITNGRSKKCVYFFNKYRFHD